jgi:hypothetical protein
MARSVRQGTWYCYTSGDFCTPEPRRLFIPASPATIPRDLLEPLPKGTFSIEMAEYDKYKTTHDSITFGPGNEDELRRRLTNNERNDMLVISSGGKSTLKIQMNF